MDPMMVFLLPLLLLFALSFLACLLLIPLARAGARRCGLVDLPDGRRKLHGRVIPLSGGLAILVASGAVLTLAAVAPGPLRPALAAKGLLGLLLGAVTICAVGVADDFHCLRGRHKLVGQLIAVGIVLAFGVRIENVRLFDYRVELGLLAVPFTIFWLLGAINALNLLDGMDGLLGSVGGIISLALGAMALMQGDPATAAVAFALAGALAGFLRYNLPPATIFLGDCGSMLIGLVVGVLAIQSSLKGPATVALAAPACLLTIPILDTVAAIVRRKLTGRSVYCTDRGHLHHCLLRRGMSSRLALLVVSGLCLVTVLGGLASVAWGSETLAIASAAAVVSTLLVTGLFGHAECVLLQKRLVALVTSFLAAPRGEARELAVRLQGSADWGELWSRLTDCAARLDLRSVSLDVNAPAIQEGYHAVWSRGEAAEDDPGEQGLWRAEIPLAACGHTVGRVEIAGRRDVECVSLKIAEIARQVAEVEALVARLAVRRHATADHALPRPHRNATLEDAPASGRVGA
jgi:UDP-GlcNAc:undecaprenyl-phosphate GlcNAc-1-phosphate transferase